MKKIALTLVLFTVVVWSYGQSFDFGVKGSINSTKITTDDPISGISGYQFDDFKSDVENGYNLGIFARIGNRVYLQPELLYSMKKGNTEIHFDGENPTVNQEIKLNAVQVPLLLGVKLIDMKLASVRAFTGPAMSIVLDGSESRLDQEDIIDGFQADQLKSNLWDWQLGGGIDIGNFTFDVRYAWGITNITEGDYDFVNKGNTLTFSLGFKIF